MWFLTSVFYLTSYSTALSSISTPRLAKLPPQDDQVLQVGFLSMNYNRANIYVVEKTLPICDQFSFYKSSLNSVFAQLAWNCLTVMSNEYQLGDY